MSNPLVDNIITLSNIFEFVEMVQEKIGVEFQAPLDESTRYEVTSKVINETIIGSGS